MRKFSLRSTQPEIMDDLTCSGDVVEQTLKELDFINHWLGGNSLTINGVEWLVSKYSSNTLSVCDIGCGSGKMLVHFHKALLKKGKRSVLYGYDANPHIIQYAKKNENRPASIEFRNENILDEAFQKVQFDIITATLFLHHFTNDELVAILKTLAGQASLGIVINDLHRHPVAYYSIRLLTLLFSRSPMVKYDAPLSVLRGFTKNEWKEILNRAEIKNYTLKWRWAFRWQLIIESVRK